MHRALQTLAQGQAPPDAASLAAALRQAGLTAPAAAALAAEILAELAACRRTPSWPPSCGPDYAPGGQRVAPGRPTPPGRHPPGRDRPPGLRRPRLVAPGLQDLPPRRGEDWEAFIARETEKYRPQLLAYREMAAKAKGIEPPEAIRLGLYFTACRRVVEM